MIQLRSEIELEDVTKNRKKSAFHKKSLGKETDDLLGRQSHGGLVADDVVAVLAGMLVVLATLDTEGNEAASEIAANAAKDDTEDPSHHGDASLTLGNALLSAVGAFDLDGLRGPSAGLEGGRFVSWSHNDLHGLLHLHRLARRDRLLLLLHLNIIQIYF